MSIEAGGGVRLDCTEKDEEVNGWVIACQTTNMKYCLCHTNADFRRRVSLSTEICTELGFSYLYNYWQPYVMLVRDRKLLRNRGSI